ncbi:MAG: rhodanese-like domain-containing protein [Alphaproteobacteria bacterium]|nr:rhodanese-like domain-containing protein [Alphaproteobacteria bacterium]
MPAARPGSLQALVEAAGNAVASLPLGRALALHGRADVLFVDVRDVRELWRDGTIAGAFHCPRDMLEFWLDPESPYARPQFQAGKRVVFFCASGEGWRAGLAADVARRMGLSDVARLSGGFKAWAAAGGPIEHRHP